MKNNRIKQALNNTLSSLYVSDSESQNVAGAGKGGKESEKEAIGGVCVDVDSHHSYIYCTCCNYYQRSWAADC
ncbi:MAG: hypothetical protein ACOX6O_08940 [Christensenellales bacterium]